MQNINLFNSELEKMKLTSKGFPITRFHQLTKSLKMKHSFFLRVMTQTMTFRVMMAMSLKQKASLKTMTARMNSELSVCCVPVTLTLLSFDVVPEIKIHSIDNEA